MRKEYYRQTLPGEEEESKSWPIDNLEPHKLAILLESFASCALSGNKVGEMMTDLWENDKEAFYLNLNIFLTQNQI